MDLIARYEQATNLLRPAIQGLAKEDLAAHPDPKAWSIQEAVHHIVDSDLIATDRMKRIIAEDRPLLIGFDESRFAASLYYGQQSIDDAVTIFELNRRQFARVLRRLPAKAFDREGIHNQRGAVKLSDLVTGMTGHVEHHLEFIDRKRKSLGK
jgi:DinB superfamily